MYICTLVAILCRLVNGPLVMHWAGTNGEGWGREVVCALADVSPLYSPERSLVKTLKIRRGARRAAASGGAITGASQDVRHMGSGVASTSFTSKCRA
jgi:hypothetical protein